MREIGFIKWFGGYDRQRGRENDFGYIGREGRTDDIKVYREEVHFSESSLIEGILVTFELQTNQKFAKNLNLFKEVGRIKNSGKNIGQTGKNNLWFIECQYQDNTLLYKNEIHFLESDLKEGTLIKFELRKYGDRYRAKNVHLLDYTKETDSDIIERCLNHNDPILCALGFWGYLNNNSIEEAISLAEEKLKRYSSSEKRCFLGEVPEAILVYFKQEIFNIITKLQNVNLTLCDKIINKFYKLYLDNPEDRKQLRIQLHTKCLVELINDLENHPGQITLLNELRDILVHSKGSALWVFIPNYIILKQEIWPITPRDKRVGILVSQITNQQDLNHQDKILEIAEILEESAPKEIPTLISIFRDNYSLKCHDAILKFLPAVEQITILTARLNNNVSENAKIISHIAKILLNL